MMENNACAVDLIFLESQLAAIKHIAEDGMGEECSVVLFTDGGLIVETNTSSVPFADIQCMIDTIQEYRR
jgi:hypothetical protein